MKGVSKTRAQLIVELEELRQQVAELKAEERLQNEIIEHQQAEEALNLHKEVLDNMSEGVYLIRVSDGIIVHTNLKFAQMFGYEPDEMIGKHVSIVNAPGEEEPDEVARKIIESLEETGSWSGEVHNVRKDGTLFWCHASVSTFEHKQYGTVWISIHDDITERKRAEEAVKEHATQLEASNQELEAFAYSVSHDLRAPLRSIDGFSQALLEDCADELDTQGKDYLERVRAGCQHMGQLIDDLLNLSRLTRREMHREAVDLSELAERIATRLRQAQAERQVEFVVVNDLIVQGDRTLLQVVLENLLGNAWKFTGTHPRARIEFGVAEVEGQPAYFVRDDGVGFDMAYADKLFGAFQRLHTVEEFPGTGIGLATVQRIVHRHGGRVWAEGAVEQGATFYFTLS